MRKIVTFALTVFSPLAAVPTGWAIYAGVTGQPAFPMWKEAAITGAVAVISTSIAAGLLITDILAFNQGLRNKAEREELAMSARSAWLILAACVLAEISLSLLIVVIPGAINFGVLVFPLMSAAGVFAFAVRFDLESRSSQLETGRVLAKAEAERIKAERKAKREQKKLAPAEPDPAPASFVCQVAGCKAKPFGSQSALNAHQRKHKQITGYAVSFEPITKEKRE